MRELSPRSKGHLDQEVFFNQRVKGAAFRVKLLSGFNLRWHSGGTRLPGC